MIRKFNNHFFVELTDSMASVYPEIDAIIGGMDLLTQSQLNLNLTGTNCIFDKVRYGLDELSRPSFIIHIHEKYCFGFFKKSQWFYSPCAKEEYDLAYRLSI